MPSQKVPRSWLVPPQKSTGVLACFIQEGPGSRPAPPCRALQSSGCATPQDPQVLRLRHPEGTRVPVCTAWWVPGSWPVPSRSVPGSRPAPPGRVPESWPVPSRRVPGARVAACTALQGPGSSRSSRAPARAPPRRLSPRGRQLRRVRRPGPEATRSPPPSAHSARLTSPAAAPGAGARRQRRSGSRTRRAQAGSLRSPPAALRRGVRARGPLRGAHGGRGRLARGRGCGPACAARGSAPGC